MNFVRKNGEITIGNFKIAPNKFAVLFCDIGYYILLFGNSVVYNRKGEGALCLGISFRKSNRILVFGCRLPFFWRPIFRSVSPFNVISGYCGCEALWNAIIGYEFYK